MVPFVITAKASDDSSLLLGSTVNVYLTEIVNGEEVPTELFKNDLLKYTDLKQYENVSGDKERIIYSDTVLSSDYSKDFRFRMWIDDGLEFSADSPDYNNQTFSVTINAYASGTLSKLTDLIFMDYPVYKENPTLGVKTSDTNENGLYKLSVTNGYGGQDGDTYYYRGNVTNNIVEFAGFTWRIVRINEDGTIRLILDSFISEFDEPTGNSYYIYRFYEDNYAGYNYMYYSNTDTEGDPEFPNIKFVVDRWYNENISNKGYGSKVASGNYFCEAANVVENDGFRTAEGTAFMTVRPNYTPTFSCIEDANHHQYVSGPVGLITYDEAAYAGAVSYITGNTYYLNTDRNGNIITDAVSDTWWTMTPGGINTNDNDIVYAWAINNTYDLTEYYADYKLHVRPVINLKADTLAAKSVDQNRYIIP